MATPEQDSSQFILPLNMNGLSGRMLKLPTATSKKREILLIYGHHAMLERWWSLCQNLNAYGNVTMPDLPGFGGMDSFYKIGLKPSLDNYADYLAAFIKLRYKRKKITIFAISFGFVVVTRMLQNYPELASRVEILISSVGFMHNEDLLVSRPRKKIYRPIARFLSVRPVALFIRYVCLSKFVIRSLTQIMPRSKHRFIEVSKEKFDETMDFEVKLWRANDVRTHWYTTSQFFTLDNTSKHISLPVAHVVSANDHYFNNIRVEQHMRAVFSGYKSYTQKSKAHVPHVNADTTETSVMVPSGLRRVLNQKQR